MTRLTDYDLKLSMKITTIRTQVQNVMKNRYKQARGTRYRYSYGYVSGYRYNLAPPAWLVAGNLAAFFGICREKGGREREVERERGRE